MSRHRYPTEICRVFERTTAEKLQAALTSSTGPANDESTKVNDSESNVNDTEKGKQASRKGGGKSSDSSKNTGYGTRAKQAVLKTGLGEALGYGPALSEHIILDAGLVPNAKVSKDNKLDEVTIQVLAQAVVRFEDWLHDVISGDIIPEGYILMQKRNAEKDGSLSQHVTIGQVTILVLCIQFTFRWYIPKCNFPFHFGCKDTFSKIFVYVVFLIVVF